MVVRKAPDLVRLQDLLDHLGGRLDPRHVAWVVSTLLNLACYLGWAELTHNALSLDTYFVSPPGHRGALLGGWWYAKPAGARPDALPAPTALCCPPDILREKRADGRTDLELVRAIGRALLGDAAAPPLLLEWLRPPTAGDPVADYRRWSETVLPASFGTGRIAQLDIAASDLYQEK